MAQPQGFPENHTHVAMEQKIRLNKHPGVLDVGDRGDLACAVLLIDSFLSPSQRHDDVATQLLANLPEHFRLKHAPDFLTPSKYMHQLCLMPNLDLVEALSLALTRIALNNIIHHPHYYQGAFFHPYHALRADALHRPPWIMYALSHALSFPFMFNETQGKNMLAKRYQTPYDTALLPHLSLDWQQEQCMIRVYVEHHSWFDKLNTNLNVLPFLSPELITAYALRLNEQSILLKKENIALHEKYQTTRQRLSHMEKQGCLSMEEAMRIYQNNLRVTPKESTQRYVDACTEHGTQHLFNMLYNASSYTEPLLEASTNVLFNELLDAIARSITLGKMSDITTL